MTATYSDISQRRVATAHAAEIEEAAADKAKLSWAVAFEGDPMAGHTIR